MDLDLDDIDRQILHFAEKFEGYPVATVIRSLIGPNFSEFGLRDRVNRLAESGLNPIRKG